MKSWSDKKSELVQQTTWITPRQLDYAAEIARLTNICYRRRLQLDMTQADLAEITGMTQSQIARLENGENIPSTKTLFSVALALGLRVTFIDEESEEAATAAM